MSIFGKQAPAAPVRRRGPASEVCDHCGRKAYTVWVGDRRMCGPGKGCAKTGLSKPRVTYKTKRLGASTWKAPKKKAAKKKTGRGRKKATSFLRGLGL